MSRALEINDFIKMSEGHLTIDVRSPKEYEKGHIPHALNLPLFNDNERAKVGTLYKQKGRNPAIEAGLEIVGPKMAGFVQFVKPLAINNKIFVHCWRGGMRSGSMAWLFDILGYEVYTLKNGYKAYRNMVLGSIGRPAQYIIIGGRTGSGKTEVLHKLKDFGQQVLDIEQLANHRGSAFGALGQPPQPTTEQFENNLHLAMCKLDFGKPIWLEDESKNIGQCFITNSLWNNMLKAPLMVIDIPLEIRIERLVNEYGAMPKAGLEEAILKIEKRLGNEAMKHALQCLEQGNLAQVAHIALHYYDKAYDYALSIKQNKHITCLKFDTGNTGEVARELINICQ